ncbi:MAG: hypothetical protein F4072_05615 [Acidimicrobiaceae bacterium]|nr:hypothetical protein [Acidimicrobiaceae bacterium]
MDDAHVPGLHPWVSWAASSSVMEEASVSRPSVTTSLRDSVALVTVDDGAQNTLTRQLVDALSASLIEVQDQAKAIVVAGRPGYHSVGLDFETLRSRGGEASDLLHAGIELYLRALECPRPIVLACTGHSLGVAAASLLCYDVRIGAAGDFKIGMDWVSHGVAVPKLVIELARARLSPRHFVMACSFSQLYSPAEAVEVGYLDYVTTGDVVEQAYEVAADLAERLDSRTFAATRTATCRNLKDTIIQTAGDLWQLKRVAHQDGWGGPDRPGCGA